MPTEQVATLVAEMTLEEKASLLAGEDAWHLPAVPRLGVGRLKMSDGPSGARGADFTGGPPSACFPCGTALAASWDPALVERVGAALAAEARAKGAHVLLGPTVNIHRHPLAGRHFECMSEDPELTAALAVAYVRGVQAGGVAACVKHLVANDSEFERFTMSSEVPEQALREVYLRPFEAAVRDAGAWAVMAAYNRLHGTHCSEHPELLGTILRDEWGFDGIVVSDWGGTHSTAAAIRAGLDVEMPGPPTHRGAALVAAVEAGEVDEALVDRAAARVLTVAGRTGALDRAGAGHDSPEGTPEDTPERRALLREAAAAGIVLLRNDPVGAGALLPLDPATSSIAVVGPNADPARVQGGGSAAVTPSRAVSPLEAISERAVQGTLVVHEEGCTIARTLPRVDLRLLASPAGEPGLLAEYFAGAGCEGEPVATALVRRLPAFWNRPPAGLPAAPWSVRVSGTITPREPGAHGLQLRSNGGISVTVGGAWNVEGSDDRPVLRADLDAGVARPFAVELSFDGEEVWRAGLDVRHERPLPADLLDRAVAAAAAADVAVVVVGTDGDWETEGRDRATIALPGPQDELVERVLAANPRTVVVVNAGAPVRMDWADRVPAIVQLWFAGEEGGAALADVLFGDVDPGGRLPTTFPVRIEDTPAHPHYPGADGRVHYGEGLRVGYRWYDAEGIAPRFPFGHGLSYATFLWGDLTATVDGEVVRAGVEVTNTGDRRGSEVVQLYVRAPGAREKALEAFAKVHLRPGETQTVHLVLGPRAFARWDPGTHAWVVDPGPRELLAAASATDVRSTAVVEVSGASPARLAR